MVNIIAKKVSGEVIGSNSFNDTDTLSTVFTWLSGKTGLSAHSIRVRQAGKPQATLSASGSTTLAVFFGSSDSSNRQVELVVEDATVAALPDDPNERIRALFRMSGEASSGNSQLTRGAKRPSTPESDDGTGDPAVDLKARAALPMKEQERFNIIDDNLAKALEFAPEHFGSIEMLYVSCELNKHPITAFIDSGAQKSFISTETAKRCEVAELIDTRRAFQGVAAGVGKQEIIGSIHMVPMNMNGLFMPFSFRVMEKMSFDVIIGLDQMRRHQMIVNLQDNHLHIGEVAVPFLPEWQVMEAVKKREGEQLAKEFAARAEAQRAKQVAGAAPQQPQAQPAPASPAPPPTKTPVALPHAAEVPAPVPPAPAEPESHKGPTAAEEDEKIQHLMAFTGLESIEDARQLLIAAGWDLEAAAVLFFEG